MKTPRYYAYVKGVDDWTGLDWLDWSCGRGFPGDGAVEPFTINKNNNNYVTFFIQV
jgi:hypothetical protein